MGTDAPRTTRHRGVKLLVAMLVAVLVLVVAAAGYGWWTVQRSFPAYSGRVELAGLDAPVTVSRDASGIPRLLAETDHDLFAAQGYVHAQERFWEMDFRRHVTAGRLAELFGPSQAATDAFVRTLGWRQVAEQEYAALDESTRALYDAYAEGVNAYLGERDGAGLSLEYAVLALQNPGYVAEPWNAVDSISWLKAMAWDLRSNLVDEIDRALLATALPPEEVQRLHPGYPFGQRPTIVDGAPSAPAALERTPLATPELEAEAAALTRLARVLDGIPALLGPAGGELGSNSWVVSGALTETGLPLLANDPHLGPAMPSVWTQMGLRCAELDDDCHYDVSGFTFSGFPGVIAGHNDRIAWGLTNLGPDVADLSLERLEGDAVELDGALVPLGVREETIRVAGGEDVTIRVRSTARGPIVSDLGGDFADIAADSPAEASGREIALSLQWTALEPGRTAAAVFGIDRARNWDEFRAAASEFDAPSQNLVYADVDGNIGYQAPGRVPVRRTGDGTVPLPGWTSENGWSGTVPFEQLPSVLNPPRGFIVTANNAVDDSGPFLTRDWDLGYRAARIDALLAEQVAAGRQISAETMAGIQSDTADANAAAFLPVLAELAPAAEGDAARGIRLLEGWDARAEADSAEAAYFAVFWRNLLADLFVGRVPEAAEPAGGDRWFQVVGSLLAEPDSPWWTNEQLGTTGRDELLLTALDQAWTETSERLGGDPDDWRWGRLHTLTIENASFGVSGVAPIEWLFNRGPIELGGGSSIVDAAGWDARDGYVVDWVPSMRMVVDLDDLDASSWVNLTGASGHAFHPHYSDQTEDWQHGRLRPWPFTADAVAASTAHTLMLLPGR